MYRIYHKIRTLHKLNDQSYNYIRTMHKIQLNEKDKNTESMKVQRCHSVQWVTHCYTENLLLGTSYSELISLPDNIPCYLYQL